MTNSRASKDNKYVLLDHHLATGTEATDTYTPSTALDMKGQYRELIMIITGKATAALGLEIKISGSTDYNVNYIDADTTTVSTALIDAHTVVPIIGSGEIDGAVSFHAKISIFFNDANDTMCVSSHGGATHEGSQINIAEDVATATTISSIETKTSTSTWIAGTEITIYGIKR